MSGPYEKAFAKTWMYREDVRKQLHNEIVRRLLKWRPPGGPAQTVDRLVGEIRDAVERERPFAITLCCSLMGELIFASPTGSFYPTHLDRNRRGSLHEPLKALRHACCHPALVADSPPILKLVEILKGDTTDRALGERLERNWAELGSPDVARWALRQVGVVGLHELRELDS